MERKRVGKVRKRNRNSARKRNLSLQELQTPTGVSDSSDEGMDFDPQELPNNVPPENVNNIFNVNSEIFQADPPINQEKDQDPWEMKVRPTARLSVGQFLALFSKISESSKLSNNVINSLLYIQSLMFAEHQEFPSSLYLLKSGLEKRDMMRKVKSHSICLACGTYVGPVAKMPAVCPHESCREKLNPQDSSFVYLPLEPVQQRHLSRSDLDAVCPEPAREGLLDFTAGTVYKRYYDSGQKFVPLVVFSDGASTAKSSNASVWVAQYHVPSRVDKPRPNLSTIWFRSSRLAKIKWKEPATFKQGLLRPFVNEIVKLQTNGVLFEKDGEAANASLRILYWIADSQERWRISNQAAFSGPFGCVHCEASGKRMPLSAENNRSVQCYPLTNTTNLFENLVDLRNVDRVRESARQAENTTAEEELDPVLLKGVRGYTVLSELLDFDFVIQVPPEPMHLCFEGIEKLLMDFRKAGPVWKLTAEQKRSIDEYLLALQPPSELTRLRPLSQSGQWKAHEYLGFTLYYSLPCLYGVLNENHFLTYAKFAASCQILFGPFLREEHLFPVSQALLEFSLELQKTAGERFMTYNLHQLWSHLVAYTYHLGHPASFWAFEHESYIGNLKRHLKGSVNPAKELAEKTALAEASQRLNAAYVRYCPDENVAKAYTAVTAGLHVNQKTVRSPAVVSYFFGAAEDFQSIRETDRNLYDSIKCAFPETPEDEILLYNRRSSPAKIHLDSVDYRRKKLHVNSAFFTKAGTCFLAKKFLVSSSPGCTTAHIAAYKTTEKEWHCFGFSGDKLLQLELSRKIYKCIEVSDEIQIFSLDEVFQKAMIMPDRKENNLVISLNWNMLG